jgi:hypothetical protein
MWFFKDCPLFFGRYAIFFDEKMEADHVNPKKHVVCTFMDFIIILIAHYALLVTFHYFYEINAAP